MKFDFCHRAIVRRYRVRIYAIPFLNCWNICVFLFHASINVLRRQNRDFELVNLIDYKNSFNNTQSKYRFSITNFPMTNSSFVESKFKYLYVLQIFIYTGSYFLLTDQSRGLYLRLKFYPSSLNVHIFY